MELVPKATFDLTETRVSRDPPKPAPVSLCLQSTEWVFIWSGSHMAENLRTMVGSLTTPICIYVQ